MTYRTTASTSDFDSEDLSSILSRSSMVYIIIIGVVGAIVVATFGRHVLEKEDNLELEKLRKFQSDLEWKVEQLESHFKLYNIRTERYISDRFDIFNDNERIDFATVYDSELSARRSLKRYLIRKTKGKLL